MELASEDTKELHIGLHCLRDESRLNMDFGSDGQVRFGTHDIRLAGDLIQSLAVYLNLTDLQVKLIGTSFIFFYLGLWWL